MNASDPSGLYTAGVCVGGSVGAGFFKQILDLVPGGLSSFAGAASACLVHTINTTADEWAVTATFGFSGSAMGIWAGVGLAVQASTANHLSALRGEFHDAFATFDIFSGDVFWVAPGNVDANGVEAMNGVYGGDIGVGKGVGVGFGKMMTNTGVHMLNDWFTKNVAERLYYGMLNGGSADTTALQQLPDIVAASSVKANAVCGNA